MVKAKIFSHENLSDLLNFDFTIMQTPPSVSNRLLHHMPKFNFLRSYLICGDISTFPNLVSVHHLTGTWNWDSAVAMTVT